MSASQETGTVILVEDDEILRNAMVQALELSGLAVEAFESATRAARYLMPSFPGCVVTDIRMDGMDGMELFGQIRKLDPEIPVILITGHGDIDMAVRAMHDGAFDFLAKPFATDHLAAVVRKALQSRRLVLDNRALRKAIADTPDGLVAQSRAMTQLRANIAQVALTTIDVHIEGETGTGKEYWARQFHRQSSRYAHPFLVLSAARLSEMPDLSEAVRACQGGTLYLEDCEGLGSLHQARLAALLDERDRASLDGARATDFRLVASTRGPLSETSIGENLAYRIGPIKLRIPPLRERREDIPVLFAQFVREALDQTGRKKFEMSASDRKRLLEYDWPGNIRELRNYAFGAVLNLPRQALGSLASQGAKDLATRVGEYERMVIVEALEATGGHVVRTCALLGTPRKTLYEKLSRYGVDPSRFRPAKPS